MIEVRRERVFSKPPERVWVALTQRAALQVWLGRTDLVPEVGRSFSLEIDGPFGGRLQVQGEVLVLEPPSRMVLRWCHGEVDTRLIIALEPAGEGTKVTLRHRGFRGLMGTVFAAWLTLRYERALRRLSDAHLPSAKLIGGALLGAGVLGFALLGTGLDEAPRAVGEPAQPLEVLASQATAGPVVHQPSPQLSRSPAAGSLPPQIAAADTVEFDNSLSRERAPAPSVDLDLTEPEVLDELISSLAVRRPTPPVSPEEQLVRPEPGDGVPRGTLRVSGPRLPRTLNPLLAQSPDDLWIQALVFDRLYEVSLNKAMSHVVAFEQVWPGRDGITVELRRDVRWHDGERIRPEDVCFSWQAFVDPLAKSPHAERWRERIASCEVKGKAVEIALKRRWENPRLALDLPLLPKHLLDERSDWYWALDNFSAVPVGTGPLKARRGRKVVAMWPRPDTARAAMIEKVEWSGGMDPAVQARQLGSGQLDAVVGISGDFLPQLKRVNAALYPLSARTLAISYDARRGPCADLAFRQMLDGVLEGKIDHHERVHLTVGIGAGFPDDRAIEITNEWLAAGLEVEIQRLSAFAKRDYDVALLQVDLLANRHPLQAFVAEGPGNPFDLDSEIVNAILEKGGEEKVGTLLLVADALRQEHLYKMLATHSSWLALGPRVRARNIPSSRPFLDFYDWRITDTSSP